MSGLPPTVHQCAKVRSHMYDFIHPHQSLDLAALIIGVSISQGRQAGIEVTRKIHRDIHLEFILYLSRWHVVPS